MTEETKPNVIRFQNVIASYANVYVPHKGKDRYDSNFNFDPSNKDHAAKILEIKTEAARVAREKWGEKVDLKKLKLGFGMIDEDAKYCPGWWFLQTWSKDAPYVVNRSNEITKSRKDAESVYSGATVNSSTSAFAWEYAEVDKAGNKTGMVKKGVSFNLRPIQFVEATPEFSERAAVDINDEFTALGDAANKAAAGGGAQKDPFAD